MNCSSLRAMESPFTKDFLSLRNDLSIKNASREIKSKITAIAAGITKDREAEAIGKLLLVLTNKDILREPELQGNLAIFSKKHPILFKQIADQLPKKRIKDPTILDALQTAKGMDDKKIVDAFQECLIAFTGQNIINKNNALSLYLLAAKLEVHWLALECKNTFYCSSEHFASLILHQIRAESGTAERDLVLALCYLMLKGGPLTKETKAKIEKLAREKNFVNLILACNPKFGRAIEFDSKGNVTLFFNGNELDKNIAELCVQLSNPATPRNWFWPKIRICDYSHTRSIQELLTKGKWIDAIALKGNPNIDLVNEIGKSLFGANLRKLALFNAPLSTQTAQVLGEAIKNMPALQALSLQFCELDISEWELIADQLGNSPIMRLNLCGNGLGFPQGGNPVFHTAFKNFPHLETLKLGFNCLEDTFLDTLNKLPKPLKKLDIRDNFISIAAFKHFVQQSPLTFIKWGGHRVASVEDHLIQFLWDRQHLSFTGIEQKKNKEPKAQMLLGKLTPPSELDSMYERFAVEEPFLQELSDAYLAISSSRYVFKNYREKEFEAFIRVVEKVSSYYAANRYSQADEKGINPIRHSLGILRELHDFCQNVDSFKRGIQNKRTKASSREKAQDYFLLDDIKFRIAVDKTLSGMNKLSEEVAFLEGLEVDGKLENWLILIAISHFKRILDELYSLQRETGKDYTNNPAEFISLINATNRNGETALHMIVRNQSLKDHSLCCYLLRHGANPQLKDSKGHTPFMIALGHHTQEFVSLLNSKAQIPTLL